MRETTPAACAICQDERQYVKVTGQQWTALDKLRKTNRNSIRFEETGLIGIGIDPPYANHKGGRKYDKKTGKELPRTEYKEMAAAVFYKRYVTARQQAEYVRQKQLHREKYEKQ